MRTAEGGKAIGERILPASSTISNPRVLVIVPAFNEAANLPGALADLAEHAPSADVVVVDDGSTDETANAARACGVKVLSLPCNLGVGGAMQTGYRYAHANGYDVAVQFDADGQHRADQVEALADQVVAHGADLAVGSRLLEPAGYRFPLARYLGSRMLAGLVSLIARRRITDPTSGFRAASRRAIRFFAHHYPQTYLGDTAEALVWVARQRMKIEEIPTPMRPRASGASTAGNLNGLCHMMRITLAVLVDCLEPRIREEELE